MPDPVVVEFDADIQSLEALNAAAYRLIDAATCQVEKVSGKLVCHLTPKDTTKADGDALRLRFVDYVTDENVRESLAVKTEPVRNLILSLAFGALASQSDSKAE